MADKKDMLKRVGGYSGDEDGSYVVFDSRNPKYGAKAQDLGNSVGAEKAANVLNQLKHNADIVKQDMGIWRGVTPGYASHTYGQQAIQGLMELSQMATGSDVIIYDTEILGTAPMHRKDKHNLDFYAPTEIGFQHTKMVNGQLAPQGRDLSLLLQPNQQVHTRLKGLIDGVSSGNWTGMTDDVRRTLSDLVLYAGDPGQLFTETKKDGRRIVSVNKQARDLHPLKGSILTSSENISLMRQGLDNLMKWGTTPEDAILEMNAFMSNMQNTKFAGYNVYNFDQPMMMDYLNTQVGKHNANSKVSQALAKLKKDMSLNQVDGLHAVRTLYRNTYSRYGENVTLETMKKVFGLTGGQAHHALSDAHVTTEQINRLLKDAGVAKALTNGGTAGTNYGTFDSRSLKVGDRMFGKAGMSSRNAGTHDGIYRMKDGKLVSAYDMTPNPIYRNATYQIKNFYDGIQMDGKTMFGVQLYNETDDLHHTIFRSSQADLQSAIHGHLEYISKKTNTHLDAANIQKEDRGLRRWRKMFSTESGGGVRLANRMYEALDIVRAGGTDADILKANEWNTDEFVRDFHTIKDRLVGEEKWIRGFIGRMNQGSLAGTSDYQRRSQNMAFSEFGRLMDNEFGINEAQRTLPNGQLALPLTVDGREKVLNITDTDSVRGGLYGHLYSGHVERPNMGIIKKRYRDLLMQLKSYNALDAKKFEQMYKALDGVRHDASLDNMLNEIANAVVIARENNSLNGALRHITVEDPTKVQDARSSRLSSSFDSSFESLASKAINGVSPYQTYWSGNSKNIQLNGSALDVIDNHDAAVQSILNRNSIDKNIAIDTQRIKSSRSSLTQLAEAFAKQNMHVQFRYDGKRKGLQMVLASKEVSESLLNGSIKDIMASNQTAVIDLPRLNKDGTITMGSQNRVARLKAQRLQRGGYQFVTGFDEILDTLRFNAKTVKEMLDTSSKMGEKNGMIQVHGYLNRKARKAMQNLSMNNRYGNPADAENMFETRSLASNWVRGGAIDISDFADDWYSAWYMNQSEDRKKLWRLKTPDQVREAARDSRELFVNSMGVNARRVFQRESDAFIKMKTGLDVGMHSVKDTHVSNYLRSNLDSRQLLAFGYFNPMARENIMKSVNYLSLDKDSVESKLRAQGFSDEEIARMTKRGVVSSRAAEVLEEAQGDGKLSYLNMRAAYMDDNALKDRAASLVTKYQGMANAATDLAEKAKYLGYVERLKNAENISTFDGMMLMSDEAARAFETTREKKIKLGAGAELTESMKQVLIGAAGTSGIEFDLSKNMNFSSMPHLDRVQFFGQDISDGKVTMSQIVKEDLIFDEASNHTTKKTIKRDQVFDKWNLGSMRVKGWNAEEQTLILEERVFSANTTKFITDAGGRQTATMLPGEVIRDLAGGNAHAILPSFEPGKGMHGTELSKFVALAVDEAKAQIDGGKLTAGNIGKQQALETINRIMQESFGIKDKALSRVMGGQIVVDEMIGTAGKEMKYSYSNLNKFFNKVDEELGLGLSKTSTIFGNVGIGRQDIYDWENGIGLTDGHREGLVKYGRKEVDMVTARANQVLGKGSAVVGWLTGHLEAAAMEQSPGIRRIASGLIRTTVQSRHDGPDKGDVIIKTSGAAFDLDDPAGRERGRLGVNGTREISMNALNDIPKVTAKDMKMLSDDYVGTILDFGRANGSFADGVSFSQAIERNGGTALLEMPDESFAKKYIRLVDFGDVTQGGGDTPILRDIQKIQQQIWRGIKEYQAMGSAGEEIDPERIASIRNRIDDLSLEYEDKAARMVSNARDSGLQKTFGAAKMDMAGRFRIQGVNPLANYHQTASGAWKQAADAKYKEGAVYMSRARMKEMLTGQDDKALRNIAGVMGLDLSGLNKTTTVADLVLDNINEKGLYGFVNRYPTIKQSTVQSMRFMIDETMAEDDRGARLAVGTAQRLKADFDGDFLSGILTHYSTSDAAAIHKELHGLNIMERRAARQVGAGVVAGLHDDLSNTAKQMNLTVGQLSHQMDVATLNQMISSRLNTVDALETREARLGKEFVGFIDNTRDKVLNLATSTMEVLQVNGRLDGSKVSRYRNAIEEFTAAFSQDLISSKKFSVDAEIARQRQLDASITDEVAHQRAMEAIDNRYLKVIDMNEAIMNPTDKNLDLFRQHNEEIGLFDSTDPNKVKKMNNTLSMIQDVARWNGIAGAYHNESLLMSVSEGQGAKVTGRFLSGQGDMIVRTQATQNLSNWATGEITSNIERGMRNWENSVLYSFDKGTDTSQSLLDSLGNRAFDAKDHTLSGATVADEASVKLRDVVAKFTPNWGGGGIGGGVVAFGALWAASAFVSKGPTPEGLQEQAPPPPPKQSMQTPTARVVENNGEYVNIRVNAKNAQNMSEQDVAALVHQEIGAMTSMQMNTTLNVNDNTQNINQQWLQGVVANALDKGFGF